MTQKVDVRLNVDLHDNQKVIHRNPARIRVVKAGKRFGKSKLAAYVITQWAFDKPGLYWYIAPTYGMAESIAWRELIAIIPDSLIARKNENDLRIRLKNGSVIELKGADNTVSLRGPELDGCVIDEAAMVKNYVWPNIISGQMRVSKGPVLFISSPLNPYENPNAIDWYPEFYAEAKRREIAGDPDYAAFYYTFLDNPHIDAKEKEAQRAMCTDETWNLEYMAIESKLVGQKFHEFSMEKNVDVLRDEKGVLTFRFHDWGTDHPTVCLWAKMKPLELPVYITSEWVKSDFTIKENCKAILDQTGNTPIEWDVIDPSAKKRLPSERNDDYTIRTIVNEYQRAGISPIPGDRGARGTDIVKLFLKFGYLKIDPKCKTLIHELRSLQWGSKVMDDATDALRYGLTRIHDITFMGKTFDKDIVPFTPSNPRELNFNDPSIFPEIQESKGTNWILEEVA